MSTIVAEATPAGHGGIGILRISGPAAKELLGRVFLSRSRHFDNFEPWRLHHGAVLDKSGEALDDALAVFMPAPHTFTGEDTAEIHCHGNPVIIAALLEHLLALGARMAEPGEFSKRAFLNGRMDLSQAEAVAEMVSAPTRQALRYSFERLDGSLSRKIGALAELIEGARVNMCACLDFPDDEIQVDIAEIEESVAKALAGVNILLDHADIGRLFQTGARVVLAGPTNAGKSSLFNALSGQDRALVASLPGTTRDFLETTLNLEGLAVTLVDTAGLRETADAIEELGINKSRGQLKDADLVLLTLDVSEPEPAFESFKDLQDLLEQGKKIVIVFNKTDLAQNEEIIIPEWASRFPCCCVSCLIGKNIAELRKLVPRLLLGRNESAHTGNVAPNLRQSQKLTEAKRELEAMLKGLSSGLPLDLCAEHLNAASLALSDMLGLETNAEVINDIFSKFCIGK